MRELRGRRPHRAGDRGGPADEAPARRHHRQRQARRFREWRGVAQVGAVTDPSSLHDEQLDDANAASADDGVRAENRKD